MSDQTFGKVVRAAVAVMAWAAAVSSAAGAFYISCNAVYAVLTDVFKIL